MDIPPDALKPIKDLYHQDLYLQAYHSLLEHGPLETLEGIQAQLLAARVTSVLGAPRLSRSLFLKVFRVDRHSLMTRYYYVYQALERRGPLAGWNLLQKPMPAEEANPTIQAVWFSLHAQVLSSLRDFDAASTWLERAEALAPEDAWIQVVRAQHLSQQDRYTEGLEAAQRALEWEPNDAGAVQSAARLLQLLGREAEAFTLLTEVAGAIECPGLLAQLLPLQMERERYPEARQTLERLVALTPVVESETQDWIYWKRSEIAYHLGEREEAISWAEQTGYAYCHQMAAHMKSAGPSARRVQFPVTFVRQHHMTCAPATLAAISGFWQMPADHLEIADAICYNGTPWHSQRDWAENHGWQARELTVTWESALALLDRGVPFTLTTTGPGSSHLQVVVGYDSCRGTLLVRDPYTPYIRDVLGHEMLEGLRPYGPRGMALVPRSKADLTEGLDLPDAPLYDALHQIEHALEAHRRKEAQEAFESLTRTAPDHLITLQARRALAAYDGDRSEGLAVIKAMRARFPEEPNLILTHLWYLRMLGRRDERLQLLEALCRQPKRAALPEEQPETNPEETEEAVERRMVPQFWQQYAQELSDDARQHPHAILLLLRAIRHAPSRAENLYTLANIYWEQLRFSEAAQLYRFAACLETYNEQYARSYFTAARWLQQTDPALTFLRERYTRLGGKSNLPARTLFHALEQLDRMSEAFALLIEALKRRPEDGDLKLFAALAYARYGQFETANRLLAEAEGKTAESTRLRTAARLAGLQNETEKALALWLQILRTEPIAMDAHNAITPLLAQLHGPQAVAQHFEKTAQAFPQCFDLHQAWAYWLRDQDMPDVRERVLQTLRDIDPTNAWTRRTMARALAEQQRFTEALEEAQVAQEMEPGTAASYVMLGEVQALAGNWPEARAGFRRALEIEIDNDYALNRLVSACDTPQERQEVLQFAGAELARQPVFGTGLLAFQRYAARVLPPEEVYERLRQMLATHPELWQAWSAMIDHLYDTDRLKEALYGAEQATARFPLLPTLWQDLARIRSASGDYEGERNALQQALQVSPGNGSVLRQLASAWRKVGEIAQAKAVMETAVAWDSQESDNQELLAYYLWENGEKEAALTCLHTLLRMDPESSWGWQTLPRWCEEMGRAEEATLAARDLTVRRPGEVRSWLTLARMLEAETDLPERLTALDRAIALNRRCYEAYDLKADLLAAAGRYEEAIQACRVAGVQPQPTRLRLRQARIAAQQGEQDDATRQLRAALEDDPNDYHGWYQLTRWHQDSQDHSAYLEAAQQLVRLNPQEAPNWGYLGDAKLRTGDRNGAKVAWKRSIEIEPAYSYGAITLFKAQLEDDQVEQAEQTLTHSLPHRREGWPLMLTISLAARRRDVKTAGEALRELCLCEGNLYDELLEADKTMQKGFDLHTLAVYESLLHDPKTQPEVGALWIKACVRQNRWICGEQVVALGTKAKIGIRATSAWITALVEAKQNKILQRFLTENRAWLKQNDESWGAAAYGLFHLQDYREVIRWTDDWEQREGARPWMLLNRAQALRRTKQPTLALQLHRHALTMTTDHCTPRHALWLVIDAALDRRVTEAAAHMKHYIKEEASSLPPYYQFLHGLASGMMGVQQAAPQARSEAFARSRVQIKQARQAYKGFHHNSDLVKMLGRVTWRIARDIGSPGAYLWATYYAILPRTSAALSAVHR